MRRTALVIGSANTMQDDCRRYFEKHGEPDGVFVVNKAGFVWPRACFAWVSMHCHFFAPPFDWWSVRQAAGHPMPRYLIGHEGAQEPHREGTLLMEHLFPEQQATGSSGLFAAKVALIDFGFESVTFAGVPMTAEAQHFDKAEDWKGAESLAPRWLQVPEEYRARMRSMSGWTRDLLGEP